MVAGDEGVRERGPARCALQRAMFSPKRVSCVAGAERPCLRRVNGGPCAYRARPMHLPKKSAARMVVSSGSGQRADLPCIGYGVCGAQVAFAVQRWKYARRAGPAPERRDATH